MGLPLAGFYATHPSTMCSTCAGPIAYASFLAQSRALQSSTYRSESCSRCLALLEFLAFKTRPRFFLFPPIPTLAFSIRPSSTPSILCTPPTSQRCGQQSLQLPTRLSQSLFASTHPKQSHRHTKMLLRSDFTETEAFEADAR
jgi:hypothetical protein